MSDWTEFAACADKPQDWFFPSIDEEYGLTVGESHDRAKRVCARCPVKRECLDFALSTNQNHGIWAGTTPGERARLKKRRGRAA